MIFVFDSRCCCYAGCDFGLGVGQTSKPLGGNSVGKTTKYNDACQIEKDWANRFGGIKRGIRWGWILKRQQNQRNGFVYWSFWLRLRRSQANWRWLMSAMVIRACWVFRAIDVVSRCRPLTQQMCEAPFDLSGAAPRDRNVLPVYQIQHDQTIFCAGHAAHCVICDPK